LTGEPDDHRSGRSLRSSAGALLREPLVHFLALGLLLFLFFAWRGGGSSASNRIVLTPGQVDLLVAGFTRTWHRPPSEAELKGLVDEMVKEEIAVREAMAQGLDRDDTVIRRRLRQKVEFLVEEGAEPGAPTDAEIKTWIAAHPDAFATDPKVALKQVFVNAQLRGALARAEAERLLARLRKVGPSARAEEMGDGSMLPQELPLAPLRETARVFGEEFAREVGTLEPGVWSGPVPSSYGLHLVLVTERAVEAPDLAAVRPFVERELATARKKKALDSYYARLLAKYPVVLEKRKGAEPRPGEARGGSPVTSGPAGAPGTPDASGSTAAPGGGR
jgi:hypothetical protein